MVKLSEEISIEDNLIKYINRLSDYFFVLARKTSADLGIEDHIWKSDFEARGE